MDRDQELENIFGRLDATLDDLPPPLVDASQDIHRFRSPWAKFLEWVINGGAGMALLFGLVALSSIFWNGMSFGWVVVPLVLFLMRPLLGDTPILRPGRMAVVLVVGSALSMALGTMVDFGVYCYPDHGNMTFLSFFVENSVHALLHPEYALTILVTIALTVLGSQWTARRYPWLERKSPTRAWRPMLSIVALLLMAGHLTALSFNDDLVQYRQSIRAALQDPRMTKFVRGTELADVGSAAAKELAAAGVPAEIEARNQFLYKSDAETRKKLAAILLKSFQERESLLTRPDFLLSVEVLQAVASSEETHPDLIFAKLWWEVRCFAQDYAVVSHRLNDQVLEKVVVPSLLAPTLSSKDAERMYDSLRSRPIRGWREIKELKRILAVHILMVESESQHTSVGSLRKYLAGVDARYFLMLFVHDKGSQMPELSQFSSRSTKRSRSRLWVEIDDRVGNDDERPLLIGILEARLFKMEMGDYPQRLKTNLHHYEYENSVEGPIFWEPLSDERVVLCRLPR
jgi:hypothetical protein